MSAFYDQASLVVVPSGYKSGKIYAQKPLTTDGQLTFTRASTATRVNASGLIETVASGVPRLDYQGSTCPKLLLEPQRTNSVLYSEQFENGAWLKYSTGTVTTNSAISPDGTLDADLFVPNTTNYQHTIEQNMGTTSGTITMSVYAKASGYNWLALNTYVGSSKFTYFNLQNGTIGTIPSGVTASIQNAGNGWYRIICTVTGGANTYISFSPTTANNVLTFAGDGTSGVLLWGAQLEQNASYVSSYIPTTTAAVTRLVDAAYKTSISSLIGQTEGTVYHEMQIVGTSTSYTERVIRITGGTDEIGIQRYGNNRLGIYGVSAGTAVFSFDIPNIFTSTTQTYKIAFAYALNNVAVYVNGVQLGTDTSAAMFTSLANVLFANATSGDLVSPQKIGQTLLFKTRLTNAQLAELTTL
jgi:hypothetical protein